MMHVSYISEFSVIAYNQNGIIWSNIFDNNFGLSVDILTL